MPGVEGGLPVTTDGPAADAELESIVAAQGGRLCSPDAAVRVVAPGHRVMIPIGSQPLALADALAAHLAGMGPGSAVELADCAVAADYLWLRPGFPGVSKVVHEHWGGPVVRRQLREHEHDYLPIPFSLRFKALDERSRSEAERRPAQVVLVQVSRPDERGFVSFGPNAWNQLRFVEQAQYALAEISRHILSASGEGVSVHVSRFHALVENQSARRISIPVEPTATHRAIANLVGEIVEDGDTLQVGAGQASTACVYAGAFDGKQDLGWHSEASVGRVVDLIRDGVITGARKSVDPGLAVATGYAGDEAQMRFIHETPAVQTRPTEYVHNVRVISSQENMVAINSALCIDLTGQIAADSIGTEMIGGTGGQLEFVIGAVNARNGRSITVLQATALGGATSTIVDLLPAGTVVTVPRQFADIVITEFGVARLWGKTVRERAVELTAIAHPDHRAGLRLRAEQLLGS
jgi:acyl-CoA hydrolase